MLSRKSIGLFLSAALTVALVGSLSSSENRSFATTYPNVNINDPTFPNPRIFPAQPSTEQTYTIWGKSIKEAHPGVYLSQNDDLEWVVDTYRQINKATAITTGQTEDLKPLPDLIPIYNKINLRDAAYQPTEAFELTTGEKVSPSTVTNPRVLNITDMGAYHPERYTMVTGSYNIGDGLGPRDFPSFQVQPYFEFRVEVGGDHRPMNASEGFEHEAYHESYKHPGMMKYRIGYIMGFAIEWWGEYNESKKISMKAPEYMNVGQTDKLYGLVATKAPGTQTYKSPLDVTSGTETTFTQVSGQDVISLTNRNNIEALKEGSAVFKVEWKKGPYHLVTTRTITVGQGGGDGGNPPGEVVCTDPVKVADFISAAEAMQANPTAVLLADSRGASAFDVSQGIPTTESLYANVLSKKYLFKYAYSKYEGSCTWDVKVSKNYTHNYETYDFIASHPCVPQRDGSCTGGYDEYDWRPHTKDEMVSQMYQVKRNYSYWVIDNLDTYKIDRATIENYALSGGSTTLTPANYQPPNITAARETIHIELPEVTQLVMLEPGSVNDGRAGYTPLNPRPDWTDIAEGKVPKIKVRNDSVTFDSAIKMSGAWYDESTPDPTHFPASPQIDNSVLYSPNLIIPAEKLNSPNNPSTGNIYYAELFSIDGTTEQTVPIPGINSVTIHTPVVNYSTLPDDNKIFDQSLQPDRSKITLILGRNATINFNEDGQHRNILGYGNRDYGKYTQEKRIRFPFDVYAESTFYPANSWIPMGVGVQQLTVKVPEWVTEGAYQVRTESWAINAPDRSEAATEHNANLDINHYGAFETFTVKVIGRVYGFRVYDIGDLRYETVFRTAKGSKTWSGFQYFSGSKDFNGNNLTEPVTASTTLPIRPGSHPSQAATTPHNGYPFLFYFNTVGNVWNVGEGVKITPSFYFVPKKGNANPVEVNLYYNTTKQKFVRVGSNLDKSLFKRMIVMGDPLRNIDRSYLDYAAKYEYDRFWTPEARAAKSLDKFLAAVPNRKTEIGRGYGEILLGYQSRTMVGPQDTTISVPQPEQRRSVQRWFGEYNLPIAPYILPKNINIEELARTKYGGKLDGKESEFLRGGYIIVKFKIETYNSNNPSVGVLAYDASSAGNANMWQIEKQITSSSTYLGANFDFDYGDIIMFESDFSVRNDFKGAGM